MTCYLLALPIIIIIFFPKNVIIKIKKLFIGYLIVAILLLTFMEFATFNFITEFDLRPDRKFFEYLSHPHEVFETLWKSYKLPLIISVSLLTILTIYLSKFFNSLILNYRPWSLKKRLLICPIIFGLVFLGCRSSVGHRPVNISNTYFSNNHLANELACNSTYTLFYAMYRTFFYEKNPSNIYGKISPDEAIEYLKPIIEKSGDTFISSNTPFMRKQKSPYQLRRPTNIVFILLESVGASDTSCLEGPDLTPNICKLKDEGLWFTNLNATGTRTARGIEAIAAGFPPSSSSSVIKLSKAKSGFFTLASLLKKHGYDTNFVYGGQSTFDQMKSFFMGNGFDNIYDQNDFKNPVFSTTWGVSDEDLFRKANEIFKSKGDKPFYSLILTTSNHIPYEFPDGRIELYEQPKETHFNTVKYTDYCIGMFFELAKKEEYFKNTIFVLAADHNHHVEGNDLVPVTKYKIPAFIIGPNVPKKTIDIVASQIDLLPTALHFSGLTTTHPMLGQNMMRISDPKDGRALMQFSENFAYRKNDDVVILRPYTTAKQFKFVEGQLESKELNNELYKEALSYSFIPWYLYSNKLYTLENKESD